MKQKYIDVIRELAFAMMIGGIAAMLLAVAFAAHDLKFGEESKLPENFNFSQAQTQVNTAVPGTCTSKANRTITNEYIFECTGNTNGNYSFYTEATVKYNSSGKHRVKVFD